MALVRNETTHAVTLDPGPSIAPEEEANCDLSLPHNAKLQQEGEIRVVDATVDPPEPEERTVGIIGRVGFEDPDQPVVDFTDTNAWTETDGVFAPAVRDGADLGVGFDIFLLAGQSETGGGNGIPGLDLLRYDAPDPRVWQYGCGGSYADTMLIAGEPLEHLGTTNRGLSPMTAFGRPYTRWVAPNRGALWVPMGVGATGFENGSRTWKVADDDLALTAVEQMRKAFAAAGANARYAGVVWIQGQADSGADDAAAYPGNLDDLIDYLRAELDEPDLPFAIVQMLPEWIDNHPNAATVDAAQVDTPRRKYRTGYTESPRGHNYETITPTHGDATEQRLRGPLLFNAFLRARANTTTSDPGVPGAISVVQSGTGLTWTWERSLGHIDGYEVQSRHNGGAWSALTHTTLTNLQAQTGLTLGDTYELRVRATNGATSSAWRTSAAFTMATIPVQVTGLAAPTPTALTIHATWTVVGNATSYLVEHKTHASPTWVEYDTVTDAAADIAELLNDTQYDVRVSAVNAAGTGTPSATLTKTTAALAGPLDLGITGTALWGYSVSRRVVAAYAGPLIRVRRSSDNAEMDVGQVNGDLDTATMLAWSGSDSVYVVKIYSQISGVNADFAQATAGKQPKIVTAGALNTSGGRPWAVFDGVDDLMSHATPMFWAQAGAAGVTVSTVVRSLAVQDTKRIIAETRNGQANAAIFPLNIRGAGGNLNNAGAITNDAGTVIVTNNNGSGALDDTLHEVTFTDSGSSIIHYRDNAVVGTFSYTRTGVFTLDRAVIGGAITTTENGQAAIGLCELVAFAGVISSGDRAALRANRNAYFGTP